MTALSKVAFRLAGPQLASHACLLEKKRLLKQPLQNYMTFSTKGAPLVSRLNPLPSEKPISRSSITASGQVNFLFPNRETIVQHLENHHLFQDSLFSDGKIFSCVAGAFAEK